MIKTVTINSYKFTLGKTQSDHNTLEKELAQMIPQKLSNLETRLVDVYNMDGERFNYGAGIKDDRLVIFFNRTLDEAESDITLENTIKINGIEINVNKILGHSNSPYQVKSDEGIVIAEMIDKDWELNILFDLFNECNTQRLQIFDYILTELNKTYFYQLKMRDSWKFGDDKELLIKNFTNVIKVNREKNINQTMKELERLEHEMNDYRRCIKQISDRIISKRKQIDTDEESLKNITNSLINDLNLIIENSKVKDLRINDNKFIIYTIPLIIHSDKGKKYYGGEYIIELNPDNSDVYFFGGTPRKGWWTDHDPHPHVSGDDGHACLGNVASTIAELCSQMQIYALAMVCIDFLESANTSDPAGKNVVRWQEIDDNGNPIESENTNCDDDDYDDDDDNDCDDEVYCEQCGDYVNRDDIVEVFDLEFDGDYDDAISSGEWSLTNGEYMCIDCARDIAYYDENLLEWIASN